MSRDPLPLFSIMMSRELQSREQHPISTSYNTLRIKDLSSSSILIIIKRMYQKEPDRMRSPRFHRATTEGPTQPWSWTALLQRLMDKRSIVQSSKTLLSQRKSLVGLWSKVRLPSTNMGKMSTLRPTQTDTEEVSLTKLTIHHLSASSMSNIIEVLAIWKRWPSDRPLRSRS